MTPPTRSSSDDTSSDLLIIDQSDIKLVVLKQCYYQYRPYLIRAVFPAGGVALLVGLLIAPSDTVAAWIIGLIVFMGILAWLSSRISKKIRSAENDDVNVILFPPPAIVIRPEDIIGFGLPTEEILSPIEEAVISVDVDPAAGEDAPICPYCGQPVSTTNVIKCKHCGIIHHRECWNENGGCTTLGCPSAPHKVS